MSARGQRDRYTDPGLRDRLKAEIQAGDRGGKPGQWSARKAQLLASQYRKQGGGYTTDKAHEGAAAQHLDQWTEEDWVTADGSADADHGEHRYLPREAWERLSPSQKRAAEKTKQAGATEGEQFVANPEAAKQARKAVEAEHARHR